MGIFTVVTRRATFKELSTRLAAGLLLAISIDTALRRGRDDGPRQACHDDLRAVGLGDGVMVACLNRSSPNQDLAKEFLEHFRAYRGGAQRDESWKANRHSSLDLVLQQERLCVRPHSTGRFLGLRRHQEDLSAIWAARLGAGWKAANVDDSTSKGA